MTVLRFLLLILFLTPTFAFAADDDLKRAIEEVQKETQLKAPTPDKTGKEMSNDYFIECISAKRPKYTTEIQEMICGCSSARLADVLAPYEIKKMKEETKEGRDARAKFIIDAFVPCMHEVTKELAMESCKNSDYLDRNVISGRKKVCDCLVSSFTKLFKKTETQMVTAAVLRDPNTIDPLHDYLVTQDFSNTEDRYINSCYNTSIIRE